MIGGIDVMGLANTIFLGVVIVVLAVVGWRLITGRTVVDRIIALDMLTGVAVAIAALTTASTERREFLDVGFGTALISFIGVVALSAFVERKGRRQK